MWATGTTPDPAGCSCGQHVGPAPGFPGRLHGPLLNPPLAGRKYSNNVREDQFYVGKVRHKKELFDGCHQPIVD